MLVLGWRTPQISSRAFDFRQFYAAGYMVRTQTAALYDLQRQKQVQDTLVSSLPLPLPYVHPSYEALFFAPLSLLNYRAAYLVFICINVLLLGTTFFIARPWFSHVPGLQPRPGLMFFLFVPVIIAVWQGQDSLLFLLLCCSAWAQLQRGRDALAACLLALCLFRFQLVIPLAVLIAVRQRPRFSAAFGVTALALISPRYSPLLFSASIKQICVCDIHSR